MFDIIVGNKEINLEELKTVAYDKVKLENYATELVPRCIRHINAIVDNQKYLVALYLRNMQSIPYSVRKLRCEDLLSGISITGVINTVIDFEDMLLQVDMDLLVTFLFEEEE